MIEATRRRHRSEDAFAERRAADIAKTNEQNSSFIHDIEPFVQGDNQMSRQKLTISDVEVRRQALDDWAVAADGQAITRTFRFAGFAQAFGFMAECAIRAEKIDHHPEWGNVYRTVEVRLTTHSAGGLTALDFDLAAFMDEAARRH